MIANPEFDLEKHDPLIPRRSLLLLQWRNLQWCLPRFHRRIGEGARATEFRRWERGFLNGIASDVGFTSEWHDPFISAEGLEEYGATFFENYLANPQSKLFRLTKSMQ
jgi:hypothetical protein